MSKCLSFIVAVLLGAAGSFVLMSRAKNVPDAITALLPATNPILSSAAPSTREEDVVFRWIATRAYYKGKARVEQWGPNLSGLKWPPYEKFGPWTMEALMREAEAHYDDLPGGFDSKKALPVEHPIAPCVIVRAVFSDGKDTHDFLFYVSEERVRLVENNPCGDGWIAYQSK